MLNSNGIENYGTRKVWREGGSELVPGDTGETWVREDGEEWMNQGCWVVLGAIASG